ncbi:MAG TPA: hypothetical protein VEZ20_06770 [Allosphingosinicella sp.]|nr:hypothetical protein [Allosphingosinicella sp.]
MRLCGVILAASALLATACAPRATREVAPASRPAATAAPPTRAVAGLEAALGRTAAQLTARFGPAALDIREGTARKLQFESPACILDAYLYPPAAGGEPIVTHIDARLPDGRDFDEASCVAALGAARAR